MNDEEMIESFQAKWFSKHNDHDTKGINISVWCDDCRELLLETVNVERKSAAEEILKWLIGELDLKEDTPIVIMFKNGSGRSVSDGRRQGKSQAPQERSSRR